MRNPFEGAGQLFDRYKPDLSFPKDLRNEWTSQQNYISDNAGSNPLKHLQLPFGLHYPLAGAAGYGAYKLLAGQQNRLNERTFNDALRYVGGHDTEALDAYKRIKNTPSGLGRDEWAQQLVAKGDMNQEALNRLRGLGDEANDIIRIQNRMANPVTGSMYRNFLKPMSDVELQTLEKLRGSGRNITAQMVAEHVGNLRNSGAAAAEIKAADQLLMRMNQAQQAGIKAPALMGALEDMGGLSGLQRVKGLERAGMIKNVGQQGLLSRLFGGFTGRGRLR